MFARRFRLLDFLRRTKTTLVLYWQMLVVAREFAGIDRGKEIRLHKNLYACEHNYSRNKSKLKAAYPKLTIIAPIAISTPPTRIGRETFSFKITAANIIVIIKLNLSIGATCEALPICKARK